MKNISNTFSFLFTFLLAVMFSCSDDQAPGVDLPDQDPENTASAIIGNKPFEPTTVSGTVQDDSLTLSLSRLGEESIVLHLPNEITAGTYDLGSPESGPYSALYSLNLRQYQSESGSITVTEHIRSQRYIEGTFSFEAEPLPGSSTSGSQSVTNGQFSITYGNKE